MTHSERALLFRKWKRRKSRKTKRRRSSPSSWITATSGGTFGPYCGESLGRTGSRCVTEGVAGSVP